MILPGPVAAARLGVFPPSIGIDDVYQSVTVDIACAKAV
jgi:hypothetical protein